MPESQVSLHCSGSYTCGRSRNNSKATYCTVETAAPTDLVQPQPKVLEAAISSAEGPIHVLKPAEPLSVLCCSMHIHISKVIINIQGSEQKRGNY